MATCTLNQSVAVGDLIFIYRGEAAHMLLVESAPGDGKPNPCLSSIVVQEVDWNIAAELGSWTLSGPDVVYYDYDEDDEADEAVADTKITLHEFLNSLPLTNMQENVADQVIHAIVKPHGRDVLQKYFKDWCPECGHLCQICPGCPPVCDRYPELFRSCGVTVACPVCMGYEFALQDKWTVDKLGKIFSLIYNYYKAPERSRLSEAECKDLEAEYISEQRKRADLINERREEMGLPKDQADAIIRGWEEYFSDLAS